MQVSCKILSFSFSVSGSSPSIFDVSAGSVASPPLAPDLPTHHSSYQTGVTHVTSLLVGCVPQRKTWTRVFPGRSPMLPAPLSRLTGHPPPQTNFPLARTHTGLLGVGQFRSSPKVHLSHNCRCPVVLIHPGRPCPDPQGWVSSGPGIGGSTHGCQSCPDEYRHGRGLTRRPGPLTSS